MTGVSWQNYSLFLPGPTKNWQLKITIIFLSILSYYFYRDELKCEVRVPSDFMSVPRLTPSCSRWTLSTSGGRPRSLTSGSWCLRTSCLSTSHSETSCVPSTVANGGKTSMFQTQNCRVSSVILNVLFYVPMNVDLVHYIKFEVDRLLLERQGNTTNLMENIFLKGRLTALRKMSVNRMRGRGE